MWQKNLICYAAFFWSLSSDDNVQVLFLWTAKCWETLKVVTDLTPALSYWVSPDISVRSCLLKWKWCSTLKWNSGRTFPGFNSRDLTRMFPSAFSSVLEWYECKHKEERTATLESLFSKWLELFLFPEMCSVGQRMLPINANVASLVPLWAIHWRVGTDDPCGSLPSQNILWICDCLAFDLFLVPLSCENQISIKYWPEAQNVSASALTKGFNLFPEK